MALIDEVRAVCNRLAPEGWGALLNKHGLDITRADLRAELDRELTIDRNVPGFEDFAFEGRRGIEPGAPDRSLLYHALASPNVLQVDGADLEAYPTLHDLEVVENYAFGARPRSIHDVSALATGDVLAIVVFATEYRPAVDSVHRKHAELCFSRTGVARVGNGEPHYDPRRRGFAPFDESDPHAFRVLPARYSAWIATQRRGGESSFGPMRTVFRTKHPELFGDTEGRTDETRNFWVPLHKLFDGRECLQGHDLTVRLHAHHVNEKIRRIHLEFLRRGHNGGWESPDVDQPPFRFTEGIAGFAVDPEFGSGLLVPIAHPALVEAAVYEGEPLTFIVPTAQQIHSSSMYSPTLEISREVPSRARHAPEYVHVRHRHVPGGLPANLNALSDPATAVKDAGYRALHYVDFTGDGWVEAVCPQLTPDLPRRVPAYSTIAAPDFFFSCDQREVLEWWLERVPEALRELLWAKPPLTLADQRTAPNLKLNNTDFHEGDTSLPRANFCRQDDTVTAIVSLPRPAGVQAGPLVDSQRRRHTWLPDAAAGKLAPGWDTSVDVSVDATGATEHLAAYGLGSPFPEDAKLCAAFSAFWPAVAPDAARTFFKGFASVSPLTDEELGSVGTRPWDGVEGPRVVTVDGQEMAEYPSFDHVDYVDLALANRFSLELTSKVGTREYVARVLAMARAYRAVGAQTEAEKIRWNVLSFRKTVAGDPDVHETESKFGSLGGDVFRFELYQPGSAPSAPDQRRRFRVAMTARTLVLVGGNPAVLVKSDGEWRGQTV